MNGQNKSDHHLLPGASGETLSSHFSVQQLKEQDFGSPLVHGYVGSQNPCILQMNFSLNRQEKLPHIEQPITVLMETLQMVIGSSLPLSYSADFEVLSS